MTRAVGISVLALTTLLGLPLPLPSCSLAQAAPKTAGAAGPEVSRARQHFKAGEKAFNAGDYARALAEFEAGYQLAPRPGFLLNMAHSERRLGHAARAGELYRLYLDGDPSSPQRVEILGIIAEIDRTLGAAGLPGNAAAGSGVGNESSPSAASPSEAGEPEPVSPPEPEEPLAPPPAAAVPARSSHATPPRAPPPAEEATPLISTGPPSSASQSRSASGPVYQRWWFWTAIGAAAVGVTAGIIIGTRPSGPSFHNDGTLGRVGQP